MDQKDSGFKLKGDDFIAKGDDFIAKGDKTLKGSTLGNMFGSKSERAEKALDLYK